MPSSCGVSVSESATAFSFTCPATQISEELIGRVIAGQRDHVFLVSKVLPTQYSEDLRWVAPENLRPTVAQKVQKIISNSGLPPNVARQIIRTLSSVKSALVGSSTRAG